MSSTKLYRSSLISLSFLLLFLLAAITGRAEAQPMSLESIRSTLISNPPNGGNQGLREKAMLALDNILMADSAFGSASVGSFYGNMMQKAKDEMSAEVKEGVTIWGMYNLGYVVKTPQVTFAFDLVRGWGGNWLAKVPDEIIQQIRVLFVSHEHGDHYDAEIAQKVIANGGFVVTPNDVWSLGNVPMLPDDSLTLAGLSIRSHRGLHGGISNWIYEVVTPGGMKIVHTGDNQTSEALPVIDNVDVLLLDAWVNESGPNTQSVVGMRNCIAKIKPQYTIPGHIEELGHSLDVRGGYYWQALEVDDVPVPTTMVVLVYGEKFTLAKGGQATPAAPSLFSPASNTDAVSLNPLLIWKTVTGAVSFRVQTAKDPGFASMIFDSSGVLSTQVQIKSLSTNTAYYWRVSAANTVGTSGWSAISGFTTIAQPSPPELQWPPDNSPNEEKKLTLYWGSSSRAAMYRIQVSTDPGFSYIVVDRSGTPLQCAVLIGLSGNTTYYWRVCEWSAATPGSWSGVRSFRTAYVATGDVTFYVDLSTAQPPLSAGDWLGFRGNQAPLDWYSVIAPKDPNGDGIYSITVTFDQQIFGQTLQYKFAICRANGAVQYEGQVGPDAPSFNRKLVVQGGTTILPVVRFDRKAATPPPQPTLLSPADDVTGAGGSLVCSWSSSAGATSYSLQVAKDPAFATVVFERSGVTGTSVMVSGLPGQTKYYWHVNASSAAETSDWSATRSFTTGSFVTHTVTFQADVSLLKAAGFNGVADTLEVRGSALPLSWFTGSRMTPSLTNPNVYEAKVTFSQQVGDIIEYKFHTTPESNFENTGWMTGDNAKYVFADKDSVLVPMKPPILYRQIAFEFSKTITSASDQRARAVAFHSISFIDSYGSRVGEELVFGAATLDSLLGTGWYGPEIDATIGTYRWAGGSGKKATLNVRVPNGAEGMVLKILSSIDSLRTDVKLGAAAVGTLLVDAYWHSGYIPLGNAIPEPMSNKQPVWTSGLYFPKFPRADSVYIIHVHTSFGNNNWWTKTADSTWRVSNYNDMAAVTLVGMQGIINRYGARVYFEFDDPFLISTSWIPTVKENVKTKFFDFDGLSAINFLYRRFALHFAGIVIYDPEVPETINLATMFAGVDNAIMLAPGEIGLSGVPQLSSVNDLRVLVRQNGWTTSIEDQTKIYQWVYDNLWPRLDHRIMGLISPGPPTSRATEPGSSQYWPLEMIARDYFIALKLPCVYLHPKEEPQKSLFVKFLDGCPSPVPVTGVFAGWEDGTQQTISEHGDMNFGLTWPGAIFNSGNFSFFASVDVEPVKFVPRMDVQKILKFCSGAPAATMYSTDGDPMFNIMQQGFQVFDWRSVQGQNFGWASCATLPNIAPVVWNYYVKSSNQVSLISDVNGAGYMLNWCMNDTQLVNYLKYTATYLKMSGLDVIHLFEGLNNNYFWSGAQAATYYTQLRGSGYKGVVHGYSSNYNRGLGLCYAGSAAPTVRAGYKMNSFNLDWTVDDILSRKAGEEFYGLNRPEDQVYLSPGCSFATDPDAEGGKAVFIPKTYGSGMVFSLGPMSLSPGRYEVKIRMKVKDNTFKNNVIGLSLLYLGPLSLFQNNTLGYRGIAPSEFSAPGKYQEITMTFTLNQLVTDVYYWLSCSDQFSSGTDFSVDHIRSTNLDGANVPVLGTIVLDNINYVDRNLARTPETFTSKFESRGGVVLNPSEYVAALNPEYMLGFASNILGPSDPAITQAQSRFNAGDYFGSLMFLRNALRTKIQTSPYPVALLSPSNALQDVSIRPTLSWTAATVATRYRLQIATDTLFTQTVVNDSTIEGTVFQAGPLNNVTTYYWRVSAGTSLGWGNYSATWSFTTTRGTASVAVGAGWNIVSVPLQATDLSVSTLFPDASSSAYGFNNGYATAASLVPGRGYWLKFGTAKSYTLTGTSARPADVSVSAGWNMIGPMDFDAPTSSVTSTPPGIISSPYYGFNNGYTTATTLAVGKGYWVKASQAGTLTFQPPGAATDAMSVSAISTERQEAEKSVVIEFEDHTGKRGIIYLAEQGSGEELPPVPPEGVFDVRFAGNTKTEAMGSGKHEIALSSVDYPIAVVAHGVGERELWITDEAVATVTKRRLEEGKIVTIRQKMAKMVLVERMDALPTHYELSQNYPNPFNPTTTVTFALPEQSLVTLTIYDLLGREIATLISKELAPGYYATKWEANVPSGVYMYRIRAGGFVATKKMILLR